ncbi:serine transporter (plasmid) [Legionella adelaidensis]|uniref:Serine transporter n=1 Tax=Legionella adelaidensis TaxID=45056 RepID=A0A0W0R2Y5_9GAMM|nr:amino acid permease [Legionella adelaidensis]KTC65427.1 serine transporter [Legionella adelaidensis]VEH84751.1 serine transporter [Legionella adelaidensis]
MPSEITLATHDVTCAKERKQDTLWVLSLYGTAIGAGTLFLPIDAGLNGLGPLLILALLAFPMTYFSHQALCRFVISGSRDENNITDVVEEHFGTKAGKLLTILYFFAIFPILLLYSVAITNTAESFLVNQLGMHAPPRFLLSALLIATLMVVVRCGQRFILKSLSLLVYPFISALIFLSLYLIPHWNNAFLQTSWLSSQHHNFLTTLWLAIPVMVFSFNHSPIISSFAVEQKKRFGADADSKSAWILKQSHFLMVITVMFFVFSCVFSLSPHDLLEAKRQNISILSYLANHFHTPIIAYVAPIIAFIAIAKSFLGHYLGASEGLDGLAIKFWPALKKESTNKRQIGIDIIVISSCWVIATINPNILKIIEMLGGPIIALILFLMPMYAIAKIPGLQKYKNSVVNGFITSIGLIALTAIFYGIWSSFVG